MGSFSGIAGSVSLLIFTQLLAAQSGVVSTIAGTGARGFNGDNRPATEASLGLADVKNQCDPATFEQTSHIFVDAQGNLYIADSSNHRIRVISPSGVIFTIAGTGEPPQTNSRCEPTSSPRDGGAATSAQFFFPSDMTVTSNGNLVIIDEQNNRIRQVNAAGVISTIAGSGLHNLYAPGIPATTTPMDWPVSVALDSNGLIYFAEMHSSRVGRIGADGRITTIAGTGFPGFNADNITATTALLRKPAGIAIDASGNLLIADTGNHRIRKVTPGGTITTIAGTGQAAFCGDGGNAAQACLDTPMDVKPDGLGNIYIADTGNHRVRKIDSSGTISTVAGTGQPGRGADSIAASASALNSPSALAVDSHNDLYIVDWQNYLIRKVTFLPTPSTTATGVVNAASFTTPIAPGSIISIFGTNLSATTKGFDGAPWPRSLEGTSVLVNGTAIPVYFVSANQVNAQLPYETMPGDASLAVVSPSGAGNTVTVRVTAAAPGIFQYSGSDRGIALNQDGTFNSTDSPEDRGRILTLFMTGGGAVNPPASTGEAASLTTLAHVNAPVKATIGGLPSQVPFSGLAPGFVGLGQINITIPDTVVPGDHVPLQIEVGGQLGSAVTVSIR